MNIQNIDYKIGNFLIDQEHKKLIEIILDITQFEMNPSPVSKLNSIRSIIELDEYTKVHFTSEEELMRIYQYPKYIQHKQIHGIFINKVKVLKTNIFKENYYEEVKKMKNWLLDWILDHIIKVDKDYHEYLMYLGLNFNPEYINEEIVNQWNNLNNEEMNTYENLLSKDPIEMDIEEERDLFKLSNKIIK